MASLMAPFRNAGLTKLLGSQDGKTTQASPDTKTVVLFTDKIYTPAELAELSAKLSTKQRMIEVRVEPAKGCTFRLHAGMTMVDRAAKIAWISCARCSNPFSPYMDESGTVIPASCLCTNLND